MRNKRKIISFLLVCLLMFNTTTLATSTELENMKNEKSQIEDQMEQKSEEVESIKGKISVVNSEIRAIDSQLQSSQERLTAIQSEITELEEEIEKNQEKLDSAQESLRETEEDMENVVREQYMSGDIVFLEVFFGSSSIVDFLTKLDIVQSVVEKDQELLDFTDRQIEYIEELEATLREQEEKLHSRRDAEQAELDRLEDLNREKTSYLNILIEDKAYAEAEYDIYLEKDASLTEEIKKLEKKLEEERKAEEARRAAAQSAGISHVTGNGELSWPVPGHNRITSGYGYRIHPIFNTKRFHAGIDIGAPTGTPICAAGDGIVIFTGWQGGYGNTVMVSHGDGLVTLYAHNSSISVSIGDYVSTGQEIAKCGSSGFSTGPHLHFEVRVNGETSDPIGWL